MDAEPQRFDDVPGAWSSGADGVRVVLGEEEELIVDESRVIGGYHFGDVDEIGKRASFGDAVVEVCRRDGHYMIRPRHRNHDVRTEYVGTPAYPASIDWVVTGILIPFDAPEPVTVGATVEGLSHVYQSPGEIEFGLEGQILRLTAFNGDEPDEPDELFIVFTDLTAGTTTYAPSRFLDVSAPGSDHLVTLDFNRATNPPCAYTDFATCPLPPAGNHLPVRVEAGEQLPLASH